MSARVSICLPVLNAGRFLSERIRTIREQTLRDFEVVVIDGFSDDGSWEELQSAASADLRFRLFREPRRGIYDAINLGVQRSQGELIYIATADDTMRRDCLERMVRALDEHPDCGLAHCELLVIDEAGRPAVPGWRDFRNAFSFIGAGPEPHVRPAPHDGLLHCRGVSVYSSLTQLVIRRTVFDAVGPFKGTWGPRGDFEWNMRAAMLFGTVHLPHELATWRRHPAQATQEGLQDSGGLLELAAMVEGALRTSRRLTRAPWASTVTSKLATYWIHRQAFWAGYLRPSGRIARAKFLFRWLLRRPSFFGDAIARRIWRRTTLSEASLEERWLRSLYERAGASLKTPFRQGVRTE